MNGREHRSQDMILVNSIWFIEYIFIRFEFFFLVNKRELKEKKKVIKINCNFFLFINRFVMGYRR